MDPIDPIDLINSHDSFTREARELAELFAVVAESAMARHDPYLVLCAWGEVAAFVADSCGMDAAQFMKAMTDEAERQYRNLGPEAAKFLKDGERIIDQRRSPNNN